MTTIILVSIGVLLAALSALFVIFYGGEAFTAADEKAEAARLLGEGVQIQAAYQAFRAQEDRTPGNGTGIDAKAIKEMLCQDYLTQVPQGVAKTQQVAYTPAECSSSAIKGESPWKIDYNYGIARSIVGPAKENGEDSAALGICRAARRSQGLTGEPLRCDDATITSKEPCCIMSLDDASK